MSLFELPFGSVPAARKSDWESVLYYMKPIIDLYTGEGVTEIMVDAYNDIKIEQNSKKIIVDAKHHFSSEQDLVRLIHQIANALEQNVDDNNPILEARFPDTSRLVATLDRVTPYGATMTIRIAPKKMLTFADLLDYGSISPQMVDYIAEQMQDEVNFAVSGNTGSGKTSFLRCCAEFISKDARIITCEDNLELYLKLRLPHSFPMEAPRRKATDAEAVVDLSTLIRTSLRQYPDHVWVGEIRSASAADAWMQVQNTGHSLTATTIHSNNAEDTVERIAYLLASGGLFSYELSKKQILGNTSMFVHCSRNHKKYGRKVTQIMRSNGNELEPVFVYDISSNEHKYLGRKFY